MVAPSLAVVFGTAAAAALAIMAQAGMGIGAVWWDM